MGQRFFESSEFNAIVANFPSSGIFQGRFEGDSKENFAPIPCAFDFLRLLAPEILPKYKISPLYSVSQGD